MGCFSACDKSANWSLPPRRIRLCSQNGRNLKILEDVSIVRSWRIAPYLTGKLSRCTICSRQSWRAVRVPLIRQVLLLCSEVSHKTNYPSHHEQDFGVGDEFEDLKEAARVLLLERGVAWPAFLGWNHVQCECLEASCPRNYKAIGTVQPYGKIGQVVLMKATWENSCWVF